MPGKEPMALPVYKESDRYPEPKAQPQEAAPPAPSPMALFPGLKATLPGVRGLRMLLPVQQRRLRHKAPHQGETQGLTPPPGGVIRPLIHKRKATRVQSITDQAIPV